MTTTLCDDVTLGRMLGVFLGNRERVAAMMGGISDDLGMGADAHGRNIGRFPACDGGTWEENR